MTAPKKNCTPGHATATPPLVQQVHSRFAWPRRGYRSQCIVLMRPEFIRKTNLEEMYPPQLDEICLYDHDKKTENISLSFLTRKVRGLQRVGSRFGRTARGGPTATQAEPSSLSRRRTCENAFSENNYLPKFAKL